MVAIVDETGDLDLDKLSAGINKSLPVYARPLFLRVVKTPVSLTGRFVFQLYFGHFYCTISLMCRHVQDEKK